MLHFPSSVNGIPRRSDSLHLNATQQKSSSHPIFLKVEEELHDARRVHSDGQEDDLRSALSMVINRVSELSALLSEAYKTQADLEVQLNVAKSNLQLVIANNEMLEDALKRDTTGQSKDVGWRRTSAREAENPRTSLERSQSVDHYVPSSDPSPPPSASTPSTQDNRFFKFRFSGNTNTNPRPASRPSTPSGSSSLVSSPQIPGVQTHHLTSPSMPSLSSVRSKELEELSAELEKERKAKKKIAEEKAALEEELESLSQALFEEANKMVATERKMRAETEDELKEVKLEKEALKSALRLIDVENAHLRESNPLASPKPEVNHSTTSYPRGHSRSSSEVAIKSRPDSLVLEAYPPLPPSPAPDAVRHEDDHPLEANTLLSPPVQSPEDDSQPTPRFRIANMPVQDDVFGSSAWADVPSSTPSSPHSSSHSSQSQSPPLIQSAAMFAAIH
ncbi:hypothetical protein JR316_0001635 [Psilocybe cubensis]|uniref:GDP/GTP exchange factor Sec2 N-terminal domain-containing protein n=2 Tax=Psilocybe cubensis TaxID=181762 RepID=A0A8H7Y493_PSICU|nr:hypothetical protein JR316_0001635 [Psilocybe cubensis]KAH9484735.1 hypothetical protein JR316_0001635 [Psilocybe cubensis]